MKELIVMVVLVAATVGGVVNLLIWLGLFGEPEVANRYFMCPYCPWPVKPGDRTSKGKRGRGHLGCTM